MYEPGTFRPLALATREAYGGPAAVYPYHLDHLGTPRALATAGGETVWAAEHRAWGALAREHAGRVAQHPRFQGQYADDETGLHYSRFRSHRADERPQLGPMLRAASNNGWNIHGADNGVWLPRTDAESISRDLPLHRGSHPRYTDHVRTQLAPINDAYRAGDYNGRMGDLGGDLRGVQSNLRGDLQSGRYRLHDTDPRIPKRCAF